MTRFAHSLRMIGALSALAAASIIAANIPTTPAYAQQGAPAMRVTSPVTEIDKSDDEFTVTVSVENVTNLGGFQFNLSYDDDVIEATGADKTDFLGSTGREVVCDDPEVQAGVIHVVCVSLRPTPEGVDGSGDVVTITFDPKGAGDTQLELSRVTLSTIDGTAIPDVQTSGAEVKVTGDSGMNLLLVIGIVVVAAVVIIGAGAALMMRRAGRAA